MLFSGCNNSVSETTNEPLSDQSYINIFPQAFNPLAPNLESRLNIKRDKNVEKFVKELETVNNTAFNSENAINSTVITVLYIQLNSNRPSNFLTMQIDANTSADIVIKKVAESPVGPLHGLRHAINFNYNGCMAFEMFHPIYDSFAKKIICKNHLEYDNRKVWSLPFVRKLSNEKGMYENRYCIIVYNPCIGLELGKKPSFLSLFSI